MRQEAALAYLPIGGEAPQFTFARLLWLVTVWTVALVCGFLIFFLRCC